MSTMKNRGTETGQITLAQFKVALARAEVALAHTEIGGCVVITKAVCLAFVESRLATYVRFPALFERPRVLLPDAGSRSLSVGFSVTAGVVVCPDKGRGKGVAK